MSAGKLFQMAVAECFKARDDRLNLTVGDIIANNTRDINKPHELS